MQRFDIINNLIKEKGYKSYLEIGVQNRVCFENIVCEKKIGVDPRANVPVDYKMTSDAFLVALSLSGGLGVRRSLVLAVVVALAILITARQERLTAPAVAVTATSVACGPLLVLVPVAA